MGTESGHSRPGKAQAESKRHVVSGNTKNTAGIEYRLYVSARKKVRLERAGNDSLLIYEENFQTIMEMEDLGLCWNKYHGHTALQTRQDGSQ